jgi:hypothetical protein
VYDENKVHVDFDGNHLSSAARGEGSAAKRRGANAKVTFFLQIFESKNHMIAFGDPLQEIGGDDDQSQEHSFRRIDCAMALYKTFAHFEDNGQRLEAIGGKAYDFP